MTETPVQTHAERQLLLDDLLERLRQIENPPDVDFLGKKLPALPLVPANWIAARRAIVWERKAMLYKSEGWDGEAELATAEMLRQRAIWKEETDR